jgi:hypothetical protein
LAHGLHLLLSSLGAWLIGERLCAFCCGLLDRTHGLWRSELTGEDLLGQALESSGKCAERATDCASAKGQGCFTSTDDLVHHTWLLWQWCVLLLEGGCVFLALGQLVGLRHGVELRRSALGGILDDPGCVFVGCCH